MLTPWKLGYDRERVGLLTHSYRVRSSQWEARIEKMLGGFPLVENGVTLTIHVSPDTCPARDEYYPGIDILAGNFIP